MIKNCIVYEKVGSGSCTLCNVGYTLLNYNNGSQHCDQNTQNCTAKQYLVGKICFNNVDNCAEFKRLTGVCNLCSAGYSLANNTCVAISSQSPIVC